MLKLTRQGKAILFLYSTMHTQGNSMCFTNEMHLKSKHEAKATADKSKNNSYRLSYNI